EVSLFLQAKHCGLGSVKLEPIELSTNRRSQEGLVKWFNESFPRVLPAQEDQTSGAVPYLPASPHEPALPGAAVTWHCGYDREEEAKKVVAIVREASGSKAILVRNRAHLDEIVPALKEAGVRFRALDIEQLGEKQVVQDLYALTLALGGPACVESETDLEDAEIFLDELERLEEAGEVDLAALEDKIDRRLYAQPDVKATKDAVEIMTIHRAKGLEFDTVIVPGLDR